MVQEFKKSDRRTRRTRKQLKQSFIELLAIKGYGGITVKDIVEQADYNRTTFYHHYQYKEELVEEITSELLTGLSYSLQNSIHLYPYNAHTSDFSIFNYVQKNKEFFKLWKHSDAIPGFMEEFIQTISNEFQEHLVSSQRDENANYIFITFCTYGVFGLIIEWIRDDFSGSPAEMDDKCEEIIKKFEANYRFSERETPSSLGVG
ncbi:TetR/AcrR family transcriptional regulator [Bacillus sp. B15-48]|uniref:TetR/AcrR family transcriptional regulator n=1 Tax=Bacillus sp. B15-48 TaxID=1548601 RepID=UPI00193ED748|nr:TetR/AcrR family transcriptional regulator [Bacillus sp. B15-48]MBM4763849.1 TetR family transcriptional regulator [Bacillus sp. B15-48]